MTDIAKTTAPGVNGDEELVTRQRVMVTFFTTTYPLETPEQAYAVPTTTLPDGLNKLVQSLLDIDPESQSFDFLVNDEYVTTTLERFMRRRGISFEDILNVEYTPALQAKEGSRLPHDDWVATVRVPFSGQSNILLTGSYDRCVRVWDGDDCISVGTFHREAVKQVALHPRTPQASAPESAQANSQGNRRRKRGAQVQDFCFASCGKDGSVVAWRFSSATGRVEPIGSVRAHTDSVDTVDISPVDGSYVCSGSWDCSVKLFDWERVASSDAEVLPEKKAPVLAFTDHARPVVAVRFSQVDDSRVLYSAGLDGVVKMWDVTKGQLKGDLAGSHAVQSLAIKPASSGGSVDVILASCTDNKIRLYESRMKQAVMTFTGHRQWVYASTWMWRRDEVGATETQNAMSASSHDVFVSASEDATLRVWDLRCASGALLTLDSVHTDGVLDITYAGNKEIASCGKDNKTKTSTISK